MQMVKKNMFLEGTNDIANPKCHFLAENIYAL